MNLCNQSACRCRAANNGVGIRIIQHHDVVKNLLGFARTIPRSHFFQEGEVVELLAARASIVAHREYHHSDGILFREWFGLNSVRLVLNRHEALGFLDGLCDVRVYAAQIGSEQALMFFRQGGEHRTSLGIGIPCLACFPVKVHN